MHIIEDRSVTPLLHLLKTVNRAPPFQLLILSMINNWNKYGTGQGS